MLGAFDSGSSLVSYVGWQSDDALEDQRAHASVSALGIGAITLSAELAVSSGGSADIALGGEWSRDYELDLGPTATSTPGQLARSSVPGS